MVVNPNLMNILTFAAGAMALVAILSVVSDLFLKDRERINRRMDREFGGQRDSLRKSPLFKNLGITPNLSELEDEHIPLKRRWELMLVQAGLNWRPSQLLAFMGGAAALLAVPGFVLAGPILAAITMVIGGLIPLCFVLVKRKNRLEKLLQQLPDAFDLMARVVRAGQTVTQGMQAVSDEFTSPIAEEFAFCFEQQNLGMPPEIALRDLAQRTSLLEVRIFVLALVVQQRTGGNLAELLDKLSEVIRQRFKIRTKIKTLTAEGRMQALILLMLPPVILGIILMTSRSYANVLLQYPGLLIGSAVSEILGALWIRRIVNFEA